MFANPRVLAPVPRRSLWLGLAVIVALCVLLVARVAFGQEAAPEAAPAPAAAVPWAAVATGIGVAFSLLYQLAKPMLGARLAGSRWGDLALIVLSALAAGAAQLAAKVPPLTVLETTVGLLGGALGTWAARYPATAEAAAKAQARAEDAAAGQVQP